MVILQMVKLINAHNVPQIALLVLIIDNKEILIYVQAATIKIHTYK